MGEVGHDLHRIFPDRGEAIHRLKIGDEHFRALADRHHLLGREIHRIEAGIDAASDRRLEDLKKERLVILDEIASMIGQTQTA